MKAAILIFMLFLPVAIIAQEKDSTRVKEQPGAAGAVQEKASPARDAEGVSSEPSRSTNLGSALGQASYAPPAQKRAPAKSATP